MKWRIITTTTTTIHCIYNRATPQLHGAIIRGNCYPLTTTYCYANGNISSTGSNPSTGSHTNSRDSSISKVQQRKDIGSGLYQYLLPVHENENGTGRRKEQNQLGIVVYARCYKMALWAFIAKLILFSFIFSFVLLFRRCGKNMLHLCDIICYIRVMSWSCHKSGHKSHGHMVVQESSAQTR